MYSLSYSRAFLPFRGKVNRMCVRSFRCGTGAGGARKNHVELHNHVAVGSIRSYEFLHPAMHFANDIPKLQMCVEGVIEGMCEL